MITPPTAPSPGKPVSASFFSRLISWVKSGQLIEGVGYRLKITPNGTSLVFDVKKKQSSKDLLPWIFSCKEDPDTGELTGGWTNGIAQFGYDRIFITPDLIHEHNFGYIVVNGTDKTDDGFHYLEVNTLVGTAEVKVDENHVPYHDPTNGILRIVLGIVENHNLKSGFHHNPVIYKYV